MEKEEYTKFICDTFDALKQQFLEKNNQYGNDDPLINFKRGAQLRYSEANYNTMYQTALDYEGKHIAHIYNNNVDGNKVDESLRDIAIYSLIELYMFKKSKEQECQGEINP